MQSARILWSMSNQTLQICAALLRDIASDSSTDPRTCAKLLRRGARSVAPMPRARILRALADRGLSHLVPADGADGESGGAR